MCARLWGACIGDAQTLHFALCKATEDNIPLSSDLVGNILGLNEPMEKASINEDASHGINDALGAVSKGSWVDSSSDHSIDKGRPYPEEGR